MTIQDFGSIGELVAAVATIATLAYLATQIRQNTRAIRATSHQAATDSFNALNTLIAHDPALARIYRVGSDGLARLTEDERVQFNFLFLAAFRVFETIYYQSKVGTLEEQLFAVERNSVGFLLRSSGGREWWEENEFAFSPEFFEHVEQQIRSLENPAA